MAVKKPSASWTGVITLLSEPNLILDCRLFSATGKAMPLALRQVHADCHTLIQEEAEKEEPGKIAPPPEAAEKTAEKEPEPTAEVRLQFYCPKCQRYLRTDEVGRAIETPAGAIQINEADYEALKFQPTKNVSAELIEADPLIDAVGIDRRFYVFPKPEGLDIYGKVIFLLQETRRVGFISEMVIEKKARVAVLQPLTFPKAIFGEQRLALVVDTLVDTGCLKDPAQFLDYPRTPAMPQATDMAKSIVHAQEKAGRLDPERCIDPRRRRLAELVRVKITQTLKR